MSEETGGLVAELRAQIEDGVGSWSSGRDSGLRDAVEIAAPYSERLRVAESRVKEMARLLHKTCDVQCPECRKHNYHTGESMRHMSWCEIGKALGE